MRKKRMGIEILKRQKRHRGKCVCNIPHWLRLTRFCILTNRSRLVIRKKMTNSRLSVVKQPEETNTTEDIMMNNIDWDEYINTWVLLVTLIPFHTVVSQLDMLCKSSLDRF